MFGTSSRRQWITRGNKSGSIRKYTDNETGYAVSVDKLQSAQPILVSQFSGKLTSAHLGYPSYGGPF